MKAGRKWTYDPRDESRIVEAVYKCKGSLGQVADLCGIPRNTLYHWLNTGLKDQEEGGSTHIGQLSCKVRIAQAEVVNELVKEALKGKKNSKFIQWWLSVCFRADFGREAEEYKELLALYKKLFEDYTRALEGKALPQRKVNDGKEVDSKGD